MCGIAGILDLTRLGRLHDGQSPDVRRMVGALHHRGPEAAGFYSDGLAALGQARLSIIDVAGGVQPMPNEDGDLWLTANGEFYDYRRAQAALAVRGHRLRTQSDSEILLHLYEMHGVGAIERVRGQFAFGLWDRKRQQMWLGRDRHGIRPLFYTVVDNFFLFASEIKALLAVGAPRRINPHTLTQIFTTWAPLPGQTMFDGIYELPAGHTLLVTPRMTDFEPRRYWQPDFCAANDAPKQTAPLPELIEQGRELLQKAVARRLVADVEVGAYLSGGLDSSLAVSMAQRQMARPLHTFSLTFDAPDFDERHFQEQAAEALGTSHHVVAASEAKMRAALPDAVRHAELPFLRLAPVPMYLLSAEVAARGLKVVLTGEGADEFFGGYTIFREALVRRFMARQPASELRPLLLKRLYRYQPALQKMPAALLKGFFGRGLATPDVPHFSHLVRWGNSGRGLRFMSPDFLEQMAGDDVVGTAAAQLPAMAGWDAVSRAQFIEATLFMPQYLLSTQGDRMGMANALEGRYPFLDRDVVDWVNGLPSRLKVRGLRGEKWLLKQMARGWVPDAIVERPKQPYRAPIGAVFGGAGLSGEVGERVSAEALLKTGIFNPAQVSRLLDKMRQQPDRVSRSDQMTFMGILTTQIWHEQFIENHTPPLPNEIEIIDAAAHYQLALPTP